VVYSAGLAQEVASRSAAAKAGRGFAVPEPGIRSDKNDSTLVRKTVGCLTNHVLGLLEGRAIEELRRRAVVE